MSIYLPPSLRHFDPRVCLISTWIDHLPFGYDIVEAVKPKLLVELGSYQGLSYFTFCQSIKDHDIDALCYAVDSWKGDKHTREYDETVYKEFFKYNRTNFPGFSYVMRMLFDEALNHFKDESIDLLHIDGCHTYEAVVHDFNNWYPKVKPGGIVLFHDITARMEDFGVYRFWDEYSPVYPSFSFHHGFGLGVIRKPDGKKTDEQLLTLLFDEDEKKQENLRAFYVFASRYIMNLMQENCPKIQKKG